MTMKKGASGWRAIPGYERYAITATGVVRCLKTHKTLKGGYNQGRRYKKITLSKNGKVRNFYIHALVALVYIGPRPEGMTVNHIDGNQMNNHYSNLEYVTQKRNMEHASENCLLASPKQKLSLVDVWEIRKMYERKHVKYALVAKKYGVSIGAIRHLVKGITFKNLEQRMELERREVQKARRQIKEHHAAKDSIRGT